MLNKSYKLLVKVKSIIYGLNNYASITQGCDVTNILDQATDVKQRTVETYGSNSEEPWNVSFYFLGCCILVLSYKLFATN
jgi:hypothetical protein